MALYAFDGTWNVDEEEAGKDTNVVKFKELYRGANVEYLPGVGSRFGAIGRVAGGLFGIGGRTRIDEMYDELVENWAQGDKTIDIIGFSRGAALAVHFANKLAQDNIKLPNGSTERPVIRFLGIWDMVGAFGLNLDFLVDFQKINLGWDITKVANCVEHTFHAMALDERREAFRVTRLNPKHTLANVEEVWFRGVHSDVGGGNENPARSNIALQWMLAKAKECHLPIDEQKAKEKKYSETDLQAPISENKDPQRDERRSLEPRDAINATARSKQLAVGETHTVRVYSRLRYNWSGVRLSNGGVYSFSIPDGQKWLDGEIECGPEGWTSEQLPWAKEHIVQLFEGRRRVKEANWFELIGALGDEDDALFRIGKGDSSYTAVDASELYLFANDLKTRYDNNQGWLDVTIMRTA